MFISVDFYTFQRAFERMDRYDNFSRAGLRALFRHLEDIEDSTGEQIELDVIALCCEFTEFETLLDAAQYFGWNGDEDDEEEMETFLEERGTLIIFDEGVIVSE